MKNKPEFPRKTISWTHHKKVKICLVDGSSVIGVVDVGKMYCKLLEVYVPNYEYGKMFFYPRERIKHIEEVYDDKSVGVE